MTTPQELLAKLTLEEKIALCEGASFWESLGYPERGIPSFFMCDGPNGLRKQEGEADMLGVNNSRPATCFPTAVTMGASWDTALIEKIGRTIGEEAAAYGVDVVLGPGVNIKRNPLCGRNFEYVSEDPILAGKIGAGLIRGIQENGTAACVKHFACNDQEKSRFNTNSVLDERTLREIYLTAFEIAVKEGRPRTLMSSYNKINGVHASDNKALLTGILRDEWGFDGLVMTDWGGMNDRVEGFRAGNDLSMPGGGKYMFGECAEAVKSGKLSEADVDACALRVIQLALDAAARPGADGFDEAAHHAVAREAAEGGAVLLANDGTLPLAPGARVAVIGVMAKTPRYQGAGSSHINPLKLVSPLEALEAAGEDVTYAPGCDEKGNTTDELLGEAARAAKDVEVAVVFAGLPDAYESEGFDRESMAMPEGHLRMIEAVAAANPHTVVVLCCGSAVECPWADDVAAILYLGLSGEAMGEAAVDLLYGRANPSGRLTESWPVSYADVPSSECYGTKDACYREGIYVGYRYYEKAGVPVRWAFGHGLSYTTFKYSDLQVIDRHVSVAVANVGELSGSEVVQLFVRVPEGSGYRPVRELKAFSKVILEPGESATVEFDLDDRAFAVWTEEGWKVPAGAYAVEVGGLLSVIEVSGEAVDLARDDWYGAPEGKPSATDWVGLLGYEYVETKPVKGRFTMDNTILEMRDSSVVMRKIYEGMEATIAKGFGGKADYNIPEFRMLMASSAGSSLRCLQISGGIPGNVLKGMLDAANGEVGKAVVDLIKG